MKGCTGCRVLHRLTRPSTASTTSSPVMMVLLIASGAPTAQARQLRSKAATGLSPGQRPIVGPPASAGCSCRESPELRDREERWRVGKGVPRPVGQACTALCMAERGRDWAGEGKLYTKLGSAAERHAQHAVALYWNAVSGLLHVRSSITPCWPANHSLPYQKRWKGAIGWSAALEGHRSPS